jgi:hypothetical protein
MDRPNQKADRKNAPPALHKGPKPNPNVEPLERKYDLSRPWDKSQRSQDSGQKSEVRGQRSMDKVQKSGDRGGRLEDRMQKSNDRQQRRGGGRQMWNER